MILNAIIIMYGIFKMKRSTIAAQTNTLLATLIVENELVIACNHAFTELSGFTEVEAKNVFLKNELRILDNLTPKIIDLKKLFSDARHAEEGVFTAAEIRTREHYSISVKLHCIHQSDAVYFLYFQSFQNKSIDPVSGLPNGYALHSRIQYITNTQKNSFKNMLLIMLSVDNFSTINYRYDYPVGDNYLLKFGKY